jgi:hypothetical protein
MSAATTMLYRPYAERGDHFAVIVRDRPEKGTQ